MNQISVERICKLFTNCNFVPENEFWHKINFDKQVPRSSRKNEKIGIFQNY